MDDTPFYFEMVLSKHIDGMYFCTTGSGMHHLVVVLAVSADGDYRHLYI